MQIICDSYDSSKIGAYDGNNDSGKFYDQNGNYFGEYWEHEIFDKNGMSHGYHNRDPVESFKKLLLDSMLH